MEKSTILTADVLDIIFDGRNKAYGAYELRTTYRKRLALSLTVMLASVLVFVGLSFTNKEDSKKSDIVFDDTHLIDVTRHDPEPELPPPPKQKTPPVQVQTIRVTPPRIVPDDQVRDDEKPPVNADVEDIKIGTVTRDGEKTDVIAPANDGGNTAVIEVPKREDDDNKVFMSVEIESEFPGGAAAWQRFLHKNLTYPQEALDNEIQGFVTVQFIVDKEGNVSDVQAVNGPEELRSEAVRVIKKSGKWTPAVQNGRKVKSYKKQPIGFQIASE